MLYNCFSLDYSLVYSVTCIVYDLIHVSRCGFISILRWVMGCRGVGFVDVDAPATLWVAGDRHVPSITHVLSYRIIKSHIRGTLL